MKLQEVLPTIITANISDTTKLMEIRLRVNKPVTYIDNNIVKRVIINGTSLICDSDMIRTIISKACQNSVYAYSEKIASGFISLSDGSRLGLCGDVSCENNKIIALRNITSINIRIPHLVANCSLSLYKYYALPICSSLIIAPPTCGKTTFLRDMIYQVNTKQPNINILVCDERNELIANENGEQVYSNLFNCDVYSNCPKQYAFINGLRSMSPDIIVTDEIVTDDYAVLRQAANSGVCVYASIHASSFNEASQLLGQDRLASIFDRLIVLSKSKGIGTVEGIFDAYGNKV